MKKIISFSLYGNKPNFQVGAVVNVLEAKRLYPDWKCRFYTTDDDAICKQLEYLGAEIVRMDNHWMNQGYYYGSLWRFFAVDDADVCIFRDADSVVNERELGAVMHWLSTDNQWHIMHDHKNHKSSKIMAGMFGYRHHDEHNIPESLARRSVCLFNFKQGKDSMTKLIEDWLNGSTNKSKSFDQSFLADVIYPKIANNCVTHGVYGLNFPKHAPCKYGNFVGDYSFWAGGWKGFIRTTQDDIDVVPAPTYDRTLDRAIISFDSHPNYVDFWPLCASAWKRIEVKPTLILIERPEENIKVDESIGEVLRLKLKDSSIHTAFASQAIRLLAPCLYPEENITIADVDIIPLSQEYFFKNLCRGSQDSFIEYRHGAAGLGQVPMCWNAASGSVWGEIFDITATLDNYQDVFSNRLKNWSPKNYRPISDGWSSGWFTDQRILYNYLQNWAGAERHIKLRDRDTGYCRLDHRVRHPDRPDINHTDFCPRRPVKHNLAYKGRPDLDNSETIKNVFDFYNIPWSYNE